MKMRDLSSSSLGNILEWFDFGLYIYLAPLLGRHFFPAASLQTTTFEALAIFAAGFICRPLGGIFFGFLGDRFGRVMSLRLSILMITLTMIVLGCLRVWFGLPGHEGVSPSDRANGANRLERSCLGRRSSKALFATDSR